MSDIGTKNFIDELVKTSNFTEDEARTDMKKAIQNGQIIEREWSAVEVAIMLSGFIKG